MEARDFQRQYERLFLPLGMYALRITNNVDDAQDVVQTAFEQAWTRVDEIEQLKPYMYQTVRHQALAAVRRRGMVEHVPVELLEEVTEEIVDTAERDARLWRAIDNLPERCRRVFLMSKRDGMSNAEIATEMGISIKTVEAQMTKAFSRLRENTGLRGTLPLWFLPFF